MYLKNVDQDNVVWCIDDKVVSTEFNNVDLAVQWCELLKSYILPASSSTPTIPHIQQDSIVNVLILIDVWQRLQSPEELAIKHNICKFLEQIKNNNQWIVYHNHSGSQLDTNVRDALDQCNNVEINNPLIVYDNHDKFINYFYGGFHANVCLFSNNIGINKLMQVATMNNCNWNIVSELTIGLEVLREDAPIPERDRPCAIKKLPYRPGAFSYSNQENTVLLENYKLAILNNKLVSTKSIV
jgi:hypothetical protein